MVITGNSLLIKQINRMAILRTIQKHDGISRLELARTMGMSNSTVSTLVAELLSAGIVKELGEGKSIGGRRPIRIGINEQGGYILGVDIGSSKITCGIIDLRASVREKIAVQTPKEKENKIPTIIDIIEKTKQLGKEKGMSNFLGIGVAAPGLVDVNNGIIVSSANLEWKNVELKKRN